MNSDNKDKLLAIFNDDPFGLLDVKATSSARTEDERLIASFEEINDFYEKNQREPQNLTDIKERSLIKRLEGFRKNPERVIYLKDFDRFNLLYDDEAQETTKEINSIDDIFGDDSLDILDTNADDIFTLKNVPNTAEDRAKADQIAQRKPCKNFEVFEPLFKQCQNDLRNGKRELIPSIESQLKEGMFCVLDGVLLYIFKIFDPVRGNSNKLNRRTILIFENGTESNMLLRSLGKRLKDHGRMVTELGEEILNRLSPVGIEDEETGFIYILKSLSEKPEIRSMKNLYKIGFSRVTVEERIKNASKEPTYLMAPVSIVTAYQCFNMNPHKLEALLHKFFGDNCLDIEIYDEEGIAYNPKEWFIAPLNIIEQAISLIISGDIIDYKYDGYNEEIVARGV